MRRVIILAALLATSGCVQQIKESRVKSALSEGGLAEPLAACMAHRMATKLSIKQLRSLQRLNAAPRRTISEFVTALRQNGDADAVEVTLSSAALCKTGFVR
jgi:predicted nucleic acid-binding protein